MAFSAWDVRVINIRETRFNHHVDWCEIIGGYNTADIVVRDGRMTLVMK